MTNLNDLYYIMDKYKDEIAGLQIQLMDLRRKMYLIEDGLKALLSEVKQE